jgi:signal transduction histidine kinase
LVYRTKAERRDLALLAVFGYDYDNENGTSFMRVRFRQWLNEHRFGGLAGAWLRFLDRLIALLQIPAPETSELIRRIIIMERHIVLPLKAAGIAMLLFSFYFTPWIGPPSSALEVAVESIKQFLWIYTLVNFVVGTLLLALRWLPLPLIQWVVFAMCLVDGIFLSALTMVSGGYDSTLYWLFLALILRGAVSVPRATSQIMLNLTVSACYVLAGLVAIAVKANLDDASLRALRFSSPQDDTTEPFVLRLVLLLLMTFCCYGVQVLLERQRRVEEEARQFGVVEGQLRAAGRLAAEFAHQIKNPLAIINNAAFSLQRALKKGPADASEQIRIIQEEVEHSDRIITQIMGYAQLSEGHVEKLSLAEELDRALAQVFPPAAHYRVQIHRHYAAEFPPLFMQRRHLADALVNLLQNARDALDGQGGNVFVRAQCRGDEAIEVAIADDGPGIPPERQERIFEPYYTTKAKGTGIGLATVRHNVELYGGTVHVESALGKGARFILIFPAKTLIQLAKPT